MSKRILVVEDQPDNRQIIRDMLAGTDYQIMEAEDGEQAFAAVKKERPDLILMGVQLPIMDGYEVTRGRRDVMTMCRSLTARANYWRKFSIACRNKCNRLLHRIISAF